MTVFKNIEVEVSTKNLGKFKAEIKEARDEVKNLGTNSTKTSQETKKSFNVLEQSAAGYGKSIQSADQLREQAAKRAEAALRNEAKLRSELTKGVGGGAAASNMAALYQQSLRAADGYQQQESKLSRLRDTLGGAGRNMDDFKQKTHQSLKTMVAAAGGMDALGTAGVVGTAALVGGMGLATSKMMTFEAVMSEVGAVSNASAAELKQLSEAALKAGQSTIFTATEAAKGQAELAKAGISVKDILGGGLKGVLDLAAAGQDTAVPKSPLHRNGVPLPCSGPTRRRDSNLIREVASGRSSGAVNWTKENSSLAGFRLGKLLSDDLK